MDRRGSDMFPGRDEGPTAGVITIRVHTVASEEFDCPVLSEKGTVSSRNWKTEQTIRQSTDFVQERAKRGFRRMKESFIRGSNLSHVEFLH